VTLPRMTTRRWMLAVATVAMLCAGGLTIYRRSAHFQALAEHHGSKAGVLQLTGPNGGPAGEIRILGINDVPINRKLADWHLELRDKYRAASRRPWLPVPPDPPPPE